MRPRKRILLIDPIADERGMTRFVLEVRGFRVVSAGWHDAKLTYNSETCRVVGRDGIVDVSWPVELAEMRAVIEALKNAAAGRPGPVPGSHHKPVVSVDAEMVERRTA